MLLKLINKIWKMIPLTPQCVQSIKLLRGKPSNSNYKYIDNKLCKIITNNNDVNDEKFNEVSKVLVNLH